MARIRRQTASILPGALLALTLAGACARGPAVELIPHPQPQPEAPAPETAEVPEEPAVDIDALYAELDYHRRQYEEGIDLLGAGEELAGEAKISLAAAAIRQDAANCASIAGCSVERYFDAFELLLRRQEIALKQQGFRIDTLEESAEEDLEREPGTSPFVTAMPEIGRTVSLLRGTDLREMITLNGPVNAALDDWLTWMRPMLLEAYQNYRFLREDVAPVYEEAGLPEALLFAMMATETGGKVHAYSRAGAAGPLQFMRHTGRRYGLSVVDGFDMRLDPEAATRANVAYLNDQFEELNDNLELALAAYNGGENRMSGLHRRHRDAGFWDSKIYWSLPRETREYVPRILAAAWLFLHPEDYRLEFPVVDTRRTELTVRDEIAINELTVCLGQEFNPYGWFRTLRNLNPRLEPGQRVAAGDTITIPAILEPVYEERCLDGEVLARARELHGANYPPEPEMMHYYVRRGDTLGKIAARHRCASLRELAAINDIRGPRYVIRVGQEIKIPGCG